MTAEDTPVRIEDGLTPENSHGKATRRREVRARLVEATPSPVGQWLLASPLIGFIAWAWFDLFQHYSAIAWRWMDIVLGSIVFAFVVLLPLGIVAHWLVTIWPRAFQNAGWDVEPVEPVREAEKYTVRYKAVARQRAPTTWSRLWLRAAQGWVYLEIAVILVAGLLLIPLILSAVDFGFGR